MGVKHVCRTDNGPPNVITAILITAHLAYRVLLIARGLASVPFFTVLMLPVCVCGNGKGSELTQFPAVRTKQKHKQRSIPTKSNAQIPVVRNRINTSKT